MFSSSLLLFENTNKEVFLVPKHLGKKQVATHLLYVPLPSTVKTLKFPPQFLGVQSNVCIRNAVKSPYLQTATMNTSQKGSEHCSSQELFIFMYFFMLFFRSLLKEK